MVSRASGQPAAGSRQKTPIVPLTDYQRASAQDRARFIFELWARQSGKSFGSTLPCVLGAAERKEPWVWLSSGERASKELIEKGAMHARAIGAAAQILQEDYEVDDRHFTSHVLKLPGARITGLPANPATARGHSANVLLDEFATHRDSRAIWRALFPTITRGYRLRVCTTPLGKQNKAYDLWTDWGKRAAAGDPNYSCRKVTIYDAVRGGLTLKDHEGNPTTPEHLREALADEEAWQQEYLCDFLDEATAWLSYDLISGIEDPEMESMPSWAMLLVAEAQASYAEYLRTKRDIALDPGLLEDLRGIEGIYLGLDIGRRRDLTVLWALQETGGILRSLAMIELARQPFWIQQRILFYLLAVPGMRRACIDCTGIGAQLAEAAQEQFGEWKVEAVTFTVQAKEALAGAIKARVEDKQAAIPILPHVRASLHSVKRMQTTTGHFRFDAERSEATGHADHFWALALACQAASSPAWVAEHQGSGVTRVAAGAYGEGTRDEGRGTTDREFLLAGARAEKAPGGFDGF